MTRGVRRSVSGVEEKYQIQHMTVIQISSCVSVVVDPQ
jgi:hypothetical protein